MSLIKEKKKRAKRSPEKMAELVLEAERVGQGVVCRTPAQLSRWKKVSASRLAGLKDLKRGFKQKTDPAVEKLQAETERLKEAILETAIELQALKKAAIRDKGTLLQSTRHQGATRGLGKIHR